MEEPITKIVTQIFNNWTALRLAVDHSMGGPNSKQVAVDFLNYMVQFCLHEPNVEIENIQDALEDVLDQEFDTVCEDESPKQIAALLHKFLVLLKQGNYTQCELEFQQLPNIDTNWLAQQQIVKMDSSDDSDDESDTTACEPENPDSPMEDDGWTQVKSRRKK